MGTGETPYSSAKPIVFSMANVSFCSSISYVGYGGVSILLKQVWLLGSCVISPDFSMVKRRGPAEASRVSSRRGHAALDDGVTGRRSKQDAPSEPCRSLKPLTGTRLVPVVNWSRRAFFSRSHEPTTCAAASRCSTDCVGGDESDERRERTCQNHRTTWSSLV